MPLSHLHVKPSRKSQEKKINDMGVERGYLVAVTALQVYVAITGSTLRLLEDCHIHPAIATLRSSR